MIELSMLELLFFGLVQAVILAFFVKNAFPKMKLVGPILMWKSKKGLDKIAAIAKKHTRLWKAYGDFGVILAFGFIGALYVFRKSKRKLLYSFLASLFLLSPVLSNAVIYLFTGTQYFSTNSILPGNVLEQLFFQGLLLCCGYSIAITALIIQSAFGIVYGYFSGAAVTAAVAPAVPGIAIKGSPFQIPWYGWFTFPILIFVHELSHGILTKAQGLRLKSTGLLMLGAFPLGAFVEPDDKQLKKASPEKQMRVYSVGSAANYLTSFFVIALFVVVMNPVLGVVGYYDNYASYYDHPSIGQVLETSDGYGKLVEGEKIISINGTNIASIEELHKVTAAAGPNALLMIQTESGTHAVRLNSDAMIGVTGLKDTFAGMPLWMEFVAWFVSFLGLVAFFNFVVGVMNLLPMYPLDGGLILESLASEKIGRKRAKHLTKTMTVSVLVLLFVNMLPLFF